MTRIERLKKKVGELYSAKNEHRADWADWLFANHVFKVAEAARDLAVRFDANPELTEAAGLLHDIADAVMQREDPSHEEESLRLARQLLKQTGFSEDEIRVIVDDAMRRHSCRDGAIPQTPEGRVMTTADAVVHLTTDFYDYALNVLKETDSMDEVRAWALPKIERDFNVKIFFSEVREEVRNRYERSKSIFG